MCGIVGVVGKPAREVVLNGLKNLEYRGYDSAGIYLNDLQGHEYLTKAVGRIANLEEKLTPEEEGTTGIGHTRWATHGQPTVENAHPHYSEDGRFYLVHNGVIENYLELKEKYLAGVHFKSETDTEVVVQLVAKLAKDETLDAFSAFKQALKLVKGSYAFLLVDNTKPDHIYIAKNKSPMMLGLGDGFNIIASDAISVLDQTKTFIALNDGDCADVTKDSIEIQDYDGNKVEREAKVLDIDPNAASKGTYEFYMLKEIDEQPAVMRRLSTDYLDEAGKPVVDEKIVDAVSQADRIYIFAAGTSYHAGLVGKEIFEKFTGIPTEVGYASEAGYHFPMMSKHPFFIFLTQSGETADGLGHLTATAGWTAIIHLAMPTTLHQKRDPMQRLLIALCFFFSLPWLASAQTYTLDGVKSKVVIDVRTPQEFASGHVEGAINIPYDTIKPNLPALARIGKDENVLLYCRSGRRSAIAMQTMSELGYRKLQNGGGIDSLASRLKVCKSASC